jgi:hypothetical protein
MATPVRRGGQSPANLPFGISAFLRAFEGHPVAEGTAAAGYPLRTCGYLGPDSALDAERTTDRRLGGAVIECCRHRGKFFGADGGGPTAMASATTRRGKSGLDSFLDQGPFELGQRAKKRPSKTWGVIRPLADTADGPNARRRHDPYRACRSRPTSGLSASNVRPSETSASAAGHSFADAAAIAPCSR